MWVLIHSHRVDEDDLWMHQNQMKQESFEVEIVLELA